MSDKSNPNILSHNEAETVKVENIVFTVESSFSESSSQTLNDILIRLMLANTEDY